MPKADSRRLSAVVTSSSLPSRSDLERHLEAQHTELLQLHSVVTLVTDQILAAQNAAEGTEATVDEDTAMRVRHTLEVIGRSIEGVAAQVDPEVALELDSPPQAAGTAPTIARIGGASTAAPVPTEEIRDELREELDALRCAYQVVSAVEDGETGASISAARSSLERSIARIDGLVARIDQLSMDASAEVDAA